MSEIKGGAILNYIRLFLSVGIGFFLSPFVLSQLGKAEYGIYCIAGTIISWLALCDFGLSASATKFISEYQARGDAVGEARYIGNAAILFSIIGAFVLVAGLVIYPFLPQFFPKFTVEELRLYQTLYLLTLFNVALSFPMRSLGGIAAARQKYIVPGIVGCLFSLASTLGTVLLLLMGYKAVALSVWGIVMGVLGMAWNIYYCFRVLKARIHFGKLNPALCRTMFGFSGWMFLDQLINMMNTGSSNFIVGMTRGAEEVAVYSYGLALFRYFAMGAACIAGLYLPRVVAMIVGGADGRQQTDMMIRVGRFQLLVLACPYLGIILFGKEFFSLWVGGTLGEQTDVCWFVTVSILIPYGFLLLQALGWQILQARNAMQYRVRVLAVSSFVSLLAGYYLSLYFGIKAMALGTAASVIIGQGFFVNWFYHHKMGLDIPRFFCETLGKWWLWAPVLLGWGLALKAALPGGGWLGFGLKVALFSLGYFGVIMWLYATPEERAMIHWHRKNLKS